MSSECAAMCQPKSPRARLAFLLGSALLVVAGCSESHGLVGDSGAADAVLPGDGGGCPSDPPPFGCGYESAHVCGDAYAAPSCVDGAWVCPPGTTSNPVCWCYGNEVHAADCTCGPSGWDCPPAMCPTDLLGLEGTPCATEGQTCGTCTDPCDWCNLLSCSGHVWARLEAPPPPPGTCESFACGGTRCIRGAQFCAHTLSDIGGEPDSFACVDWPPTCEAVHSCSCFPDSGPSCRDDGAGAVEITRGGG